MVTWRKVLLFSVFIREIMCYDDESLESQHNIQKTRSVLYLPESTPLTQSFEQFMHKLDDTVYRGKQRRRLDYLRATARPRYTSAVAVDKKELQLVKPLLSDVLMMKLVEYYEGKLRVSPETTTSLRALATATAEPHYSDVLSNAEDFIRRDGSIIIL